MRRINTVVIFSLLLGFSLFAQDAKEEEDVPNPFFAFDNGLDGKDWNAHAATLKEIGFDGIQYGGFWVYKERSAAMKKQGLKIFALYADVDFNAKDPIPKLYYGSLAQIGKEGTMVWMPVRGNVKDEKAVKLMQAYCDAAKENNVKIALYPHAGFSIASAMDALQFIKRVDRPNLGLTINLAHELLAGNGNNLDAILEATKDHIFLVSINGADNTKNWGRVFQTLDKGNFNQLTFLQKLKSIRYKGPIGLQCYNIKGDKKENLAKSMAAWQKLQQQLDGP